MLWDMSSAVHEWVQTGGAPWEEYIIYRVYIKLKNKTNKREREGRKNFQFLLFKRATPPCHPTFARDATAPRERVIIIRFRKQQGPECAAAQQCTERNCAKLAGWAHHRDRGTHLAHCTDAGHLDKTRAQNYTIRDKSRFIYCICFRPYIYMQLPACW